MKNKTKYLLLAVPIFIVLSILTACRTKIDDTTINCNFLTGECTYTSDGSSGGSDGTAKGTGSSDNTSVGKFIPDEGTLSLSKCGSQKAPDKGIFKGFYYNDTNPDSTEDRWSMKQCGTNSYFATAKTTCSDGRVYKWTVNKLAKTAFEKAQQGLCQITTVGIDGIVYSPDEIKSNGSVVSRFITGTKVPTLHSYGIAIDLNASRDYTVDGVKFKGVYNRNIKTYENYVKALGREDDPRNINYILWIKIFKPLGFNWGGRWKGNSFDGMHFEVDWKQTR